MTVVAILMSVGARTMMAISAASANMDLGLGFGFGDKI